MRLQVVSERAKTNRVVCNLTKRDVAAVAQGSAYGVRRVVVVQDDPAARLISASCAAVALMGCFTGTWILVPPTSCTAKACRPGRWTWTLPLGSRA